MRKSLQSGERLQKSSLSVISWTLQMLERVAEGVGPPNADRPVSLDPEGHKGTARGEG